MKYFSIFTKGVGALYSFLGIVTCFYTLSTKEKKDMIIWALKRSGNKGIRIKNGKRRGKLHQGFVINFFFSFQFIRIYIHVIDLD